MRPITISLLAGVCAAHSAVGQIQNSPSPTEVVDTFDHATAAATTSTGLRTGGIAVVDGVPYGGGARYSTRFDADRIEFLPAFGPRADRLHPVTYRLDSVGRTDGFMIDATPPERSVDALRVSYARPGFVETYDVGTFGIEQSFTFAELPAGSGDLVVRGRLETDLLAQPTEEGGLRLVLEGIGTMSIGTVTGIDAAGNRAQGSVAYESGVLELSLPAAFVDSAALPLILDPLIGSIVNVESTTADDGQQSSIAYDADADVYCVVWAEVFAFGSSDIRARRVDGNGVPFGTELFVTTGATSAAGAPSVADCGARDRFLIVWEDNDTGSFDILGRTMSAFDGSLGPIAGIRAEIGASERFPDVGGAPDSARMVVVYDDLDENDIEAVGVLVNSNGTVTLTGTSDVRSSGTLSGPRISSSAGSDGGNFLVTWMAESATNLTDIEGRLVNIFAQPLGNTLNIAATAADEDDPDVAGDGFNWVVVYETEATPGSNDNQIAARPVYATSAASSVGFEVLVESNAEEERNPSVAWNGGSVTVVFDDASPLPNFDTYVASLDPFTCEPVGLQMILSTVLDDTSVQPAVATKFSGSGDILDNEAFIVWEEVTAPDTGTIVGRAYRSDHGLVTDLGGGCGDNRGEIHATGAIVGATGFAHRLRNSVPSAPVVLILGLGRIDAACGPCTLIPDPFSGFSFATTTNFLGNASVAMPIPTSTSLDGFVFYDQWLVPDPGSPSCLPLGSDLSDAISVEIQ